MAMDWAPIASVATAIGVIGGLVSVAFLIYEIRRNAKAIEGSTVQSLMSLEAQVFAIGLANAQTLLRGCASMADLSDVEKQQFGGLCAFMMSLTCSAFFQQP